MINGWDAAQSFMGLVSYSVLAISISSYSDVYRTKEYGRMKAFLKSVGRHYKYSPTIADINLYLVFKMSPQLADAMVNF